MNAERPLRIAQVSPLYERVPPVLYGGTERIVSFLTEELVALGHSVTLFASGDSVTNAKLIPGCPRALRLDPTVKDTWAHHIVLLEEVAERADQFDLIHYHIDYLHFPVSERCGTPHLTTLHGRLDMPDLPAVYRKFPDQPLTSISMAQRTPLPWANWKNVVYHGLPIHQYSYQPGDGGYLAFLGRISPEKRLDRAIAIAKRAKIPLRVAAKVDAADKEYYETEIRPLIEDEKLVEFIGEIGDSEKEKFLGGARALLFPIDWPEPFGLVMVEAMACGTPVIAYRCGSVPEIIEPGLNGFIVESVEEAVDAIQSLSSLSRHQCREIFEAKFNAGRMTRDYVQVYRQLMEENGQLRNTRVAAGRYHSGPESLLRIGQLGAG